MPFNSKCILKHRMKENIGCSKCSDGYHFTVSSLLELDAVSSQIMSLILEKEPWHGFSKEVKFVVKSTLLESVLNSVEHGMLGMDKAEKRMMRAEKGEEYEAYIEHEWRKKNKPVSISFCINDKRALLGVHDEGGGFNHEEKFSKDISNDELLGVSGRGLAILKGFGVNLYWNKDGNSILCSFKRPDLVFIARQDGGG